MIAIASNILVKLFEFSQQCQRNPVWIQQGRSFEEDLILQDNDTGESELVKLALFREQSYVVCMAQFLPLTGLKQDVINCFHEYFLALNFVPDNFVIFALDGDILWTRVNLKTGGDEEEVLNTYLEARANIECVLDETNEHIKAALNHCGLQSEVIPRITSSKPVRKSNTSKATRTRKTRSQKSSQ